MKPAARLGPTSALGAYFPGMPFVVQRVLPNGREIQFAGINTDADVHPRWQQRPRAVGSFQSQLMALAPKLARRGDNQIRVLLMHHSWDKRGTILAIDRGSRAAL